MNHSLKIKLLGFLFLALGCNNEEVELIQDLKPLNSFSMNLNNQLWEPSLIDNDSCFSTFQCEYFEVDNMIPFYTIKAYKDWQSRTNHLSESMITIQIMNVNHTGIFNISDPIGDFNSYAMFVINESDSQKIYENSVKTKSVVRIEEMIPIDGSILTGVRGSFSGTLYNKVNASDSIVIDRCNFTFKKINRNNFCHCKE